MILTRTGAPSFLVALAATLAFVLFSPASAAAQGSNTIIDEANALSDSEEQEVQRAFDEAQQQSGQPIYAILTPETGAGDEAAQRDLLDQTAGDENLPQDAGVILVAPDDGWVPSANLDGVSEEEVYETMVPDFRDGDFGGGGF